jgi:hypothetical protein
MAHDPGNTIDLYRDIHKGVRNALFRVTFRAGCVDPTDDDSVKTLVADVHDVMTFLAAHHHHEDTPALLDLIDAYAPELRAEIEAAHVRADVAIDELPSIADELAATAVAERDRVAHQLYLALAAFTGSYLAHLDDEETNLMSVLSERAPQSEILAVNVAILSAIPLDDKRRGMKYMLPALDGADRIALLGQAKLASPPEVFERLRTVAEDVLTPDEYRAVAAGLGLG